MKVTREVINDLLPLYLAGEASEDSRILVEDFLRDDPEFSARILSAQRAMEAINSAPESTPDLELKTLKRTRRAVSSRSILIGAAIFMSLMPLSVSHDERGTHWMMIESPWSAIASAAIAAVLWGIFWKIRRSTRSAGV